MGSIIACLIKNISFIGWKMKEVKNEKSNMERLFRFAHHDLLFTVSFLRFSIYNMQFRLYIVLFMAASRNVIPAKAGIHKLLT
jgi:hypothetical protein